MAYKQTFIPSIITPAFFSKMTGKELRQWMLNFYKENLNGKSVKNKHLGFEIKFTGLGGRKTSMGGPVYKNKAVVLMKIKECLEYGKYTSFKPRKKNDPENLVGYFNFKALIKIDGESKCLRIATLCYEREGRLYYSLDLATTKNKLPK